jgi:hypothetical protein
MATFEEALAEAEAWLDEPEVDAVGEGEEDGRRVIDVWVRGGAAARAFPSELHGHPVRVQDSGGPVEAL